MAPVTQFVAFVFRFGLILALAGQLRSCTLVLLGVASEKTQHGIISYSAFTRALTGSPSGDHEARRSPTRG